MVCGVLGFNKARDGSDCSVRSFCGGGGFLRRILASEGGCGALPTFEGVGVEDSHLLRFRFVIWKLPRMCVYNTCKYILKKIRCKMHIIGVWWLGGRSPPSFRFRLSDEDVKGYMSCVQIKQRLVSPS